MSKKPVHPMQTVIWLHRPSGVRYVVYRTEGDEHVLEPIMGRYLRVKKTDLEIHEVWSRTP